MPVLTDREKIANPDLWLTWPILPMKRWQDGTLALGFFYSTSLTGNRVVFYIGSIFDTEHAERTDLSVDQVLAQSWLVD